MLASDRTDVDALGNATLSTEPALIPGTETCPDTLENGKLSSDNVLALPGDSVTDALQDAA